MVQVLADLTTFRGSAPAHTSWMISTTSFLSGKPPVWSLLCISLSSTLTSKAPLLPTFPFTTASRTQLSVAAISSFTYWELSPVSSTGGPSCGWRSLRSRSTLCGLKSTSFLPSAPVSLHSALLASCSGCEVTRLFLLDELMSGATWLGTNDLTHLNQGFNQFDLIESIGKFW